MCVFLVVVCLPTSLHKGTVSYTGSMVHGGYPVDTQVYYLCDYGYSHSGDLRSICLTSGKWAKGKTPKCTGNLMFGERVLISLLL